MVDDLGIRLTTEDLNQSTGAVWAMGSFAKVIRNLGDFIGGRDPEIAEKVRDIGISAQYAWSGELDKALNLNLRGVFDPPGVEQRSALKVLEDPKYRPIRDRVDQALLTIHQSGQAAMEALEAKDYKSIKFDQPNGSSSFFSASPKIEITDSAKRSLLSNYEVMSPVLEFARLPELDPQLVEDFNQDVKQETLKASNTALDSSLNGTLSLSTDRDDALMKQEHDSAVESAAANLEKRIAPKLFTPQQ